MTRASPVRVVALGDSISCGEGVGVRVPLAATWPALLTARLPGAELTPLARPGAKTRDLVLEQLTPAIGARPQLATLLVGLNDVLRSSSCEVEDDLEQVVSGLRSVGAVVLAVRLHDPLAQLRLPAPLCRALRRRVAVVNEALDRVAARHDAPLLDLADVPGLRHREAWAADRLHPGPAGHRAIAAAAGAVLGLGPSTPGLPDAGPGRLDEMAWVVRHGLPYAAVHGRRMLPGVLSLR